jgi:carboxylesterase type B
MRPPLSKHPMTASSGLPQTIGYIVSSHCVAKTNQEPKLGILGFLAGNIAGEQGASNLGFYDQRMALQWVQDHISKVGGDPNAVTAWGKSAGAGSLMHHLTAFGGKQDPLFRRLVLQSPFLEPRMNPVLDEQYKQFEKGAGCEGKGLACLRTATLDAIKEGSTAATKISPGTFMLG